MFSIYDFGLVNNNTVQLKGEEEKLFDVLKGYAERGEAEYADESSWYSSYRVTASKKNVIKACQEIGIDSSFFEFLMKDGKEDNYFILCEKWEDADAFCVNEPLEYREKMEKEFEKNLIQD